MGMKDLDLIWNKIDIPKSGDGGCWNWIGELDKFGHGLIEVNGSKCLSHKYVAWAVKGYVNFNLPISHLCKNRKCCNPNHLVLGLLNNQPDCYLTRIVKVYGPYKRKDGRKQVSILLNDGKRLTRSFPKFLIEYELATELDPILHTVDHINRDFTNDDRKNLQILSRSANAKKSALHRKPVEGKCVWCSKDITLTRDQLTKRNNKQAGPFCSRSCSGKYGSSVQNKRIPLIKPKDIKIEYYRLDDDLIKD